MDPEPEFDLDYLLKNMQPALDDHQLVFCSLPPEKAEDTSSRYAHRTTESNEKC